LECVGPTEAEEFRVALLRGVLTYDETLGPILTVIGEKFYDPKAAISVVSSSFLIKAVLDSEDFRDSFLWNRQAKKRRNAERVANLKWGLMHPWSYIASAYGVPRLLEEESPAK